MAKKRRKERANNAHKIPNEVATEIRQLSNDKLLDRTTLEYRNWNASIDAKKKDPELLKAWDLIKDAKEEIKSQPEYQEMVERHKAEQEAYLTEELARYNEEYKNLLQPFNEDIARFRGMFKVAIEELDDRKKRGVII